ncbi:magnesium transporter, partial [Cladochytrium replicatum]
MAEVASVEVPGWHRPLGVGLALLSSVFVGTSFIFKKKGLVQMQALGHKPGEGHAYLTSGMWWAGMILMSLGEILNVVAYAFSPAILITPLGALSVRFFAVLSSFFLDERLSISAKIGCAQCLLGSIIIVLNASGENPVDTLANFYSQVFHTAFITYTIVVGVIVLLLIYWVAPVYGHRTPAIYITICSLFGSYLVLSTQGVGAAIVHSFANWETDNQFKQWSLYPLIIMIAITVCFQLHFLNKALNIFSTAVVTPVYYVFFSTATLISTAVLFRGFPVDTMLAGVYVVVGFLIICGGVILLFLYSVRATKL